MAAVSHTRLEGDLLKYTNLVKGYQKRFFIIDPNTAQLHYYEAEKSRHKKPKGTVHLKNAVVLPSEEEDLLFTIHRFDQNVHSVMYLKARSSKERLDWVNSIRSQLSTDDPKKDDSNKVATDNTATSCLICLDSLNEPVVTLCGHLFCKTCINQWIDLKPMNQICPVCKVSVNKRKLVRLYGVNEKNGSGEHNAENTNNNDTERENLIEIQTEYLAQSRGFEVNDMIDSFYLFIKTFLVFFSNLFTAQHSSESIPNNFRSIFETFLVITIAIFVMVLFAFVFIKFLALLISPKFGIFFLGALLYVSWKFMEERN